MDAERKREEVDETAEDIVSTVAVRPLREIWRCIGSQAASASIRVSKGLSGGGVGVVAGAPCCAADAEASPSDPDLG